MFSVISTFNSILKNPKENLELRLKVIDNLTRLAISENTNSSKLEKKLRSQYVNKINFQERKIKALQDQVDDLEEELAAIDEEDISYEKCDNDCVCDNVCDECGCCNNELTFELTIYTIGKLEENYNYETLYNYLKVNSGRQSSSQKEFVKILRDYQKITRDFSEVLNDLIERVNNPFWRPAKYPPPFDDSNWDSWDTSSWGKAKSD